MSPEALLERFGYLAVFLGTFLEGEAILVIAGFFAHRGHMGVVAVTLVGFAGTYIGHLFWFWLGRRHGVRLLDRYPRMQRHFGNSIRMFERYGIAAIIVTQWLYGLRITCAVVVGISKISVIKFLIYEAISCMIWAIGITALGYYFGTAVQTLLGRYEHAEKWGLLFIVAVAVTLWLWHRQREKRDVVAVEGDPED
ncbi:MAG TPA: DedA family protein [Thermoanaerobaculia bacterium]|nr:DedA family protein [Thermoanaerobaculia bacterium]